MSNYKSNVFYKELAQKISNVNELKFGNDFSDVDAAFILSIVENRDSLLDIGSGTGLIVNRLAKHFRTIHCVEPFAEFSNHIKRLDNITIHNVSWSDFQAPYRFKTVTVFGVAHYFNELEIGLVYEKVFDYCLSGALLIVKNQFAKTDTKEVFGSEQLGPNYYAQYRTVDTERELLNKVGFVVIGVFDIYDDRCNKWSDTSYKAIVARKK